MQMKSFAISVMALTLALPTLAEAQQNQNQSNQNQNQGKQAQNQQSGQNQVAQKCLDQVRAFSDDTGRSGYGLAGPNGYFTAPGYGYTWGTAPANGYPGIATPRGEMRTLIRAADFVIIHAPDVNTPEGGTLAASNWRKRLIAE